MSELLSLPFFRFLLANGAAAAANFLSRIAFNRVVDFPAAIVLAFFVGLSTAFVLNRLYVFPDHSREIHHQALWFIGVNLFALVQTLAISLILARWVFPMCAITWHADEIAHAIGIVAPVFTSYVGHKRYTFR